MKRRQLSKKTLATLAMMGLASSLLVPATATAAQNSQQQQQLAASGCGSCGAHNRGLSNNDQGRTRRYNPAQQTADGSCSGQQAPKEDSNGKKPATNNGQIADASCSNGSGCHGKKPANGTNNGNNNNGNGSSSNGNGQDSSYRQQRQNLSQPTTMNQTTNKNR